MLKNENPATPDSPDTSDTRLPQVSVDASPRPAAAASSAEVSPNIAGYQILDLLGRGGMGVVWRAIQLSTRREVALKVLAGGALISGRAKLRFEREVELSARLQHPNIASVFHSGLHEGNHFYVMELVRGVHLDAYAKKNQLNELQVLQLMRRICLAVDHAHQSGVVHRDLKPGNILVGTDGEPHVLDFGLAKAAFEADREVAVSRDGETVGTLAYMSPEQAAGNHKSVDTRSDVYSLGVILFELLTGQMPHDMKGTQFEQFRRVVEEEVLRPSTVTPRLKGDLESLLLKALARNPADRYQAAGDMALDISNYLNHAPLIARRLTVAYFLRKRFQKHRGRFVLAGLIASLVLAVSVVAYVSVHAERDSARLSDEAKRQAFYTNRIALAGKSVAQNNAAEAIKVLDECPEDLRQWEWRRLRSLADQSVLTLGGHQRHISDLRVSSDGSEIASVDLAGHLRVSDLKSGRLLRENHFLKADAPAAKTVLLGATGDRLAILTTGRVEAFDTHTFARVFTFAEPKEDLRIEGFTPDGFLALRTAAAGDRGLLRLWCMRENKAVRTIELPSELSPLAFGSNGAVALGGEGRVRVIDVRSGDTICVLGEPSRKTNHLAFSPDGTMLATAGGIGVSLWALPSGELLQTLPESRGHTGIAFSTDSHQVASAGNDGALRIWRLDNPLHPVELRGTQISARLPAFDPTGSRLVSADGQTIKVWDTQTPSQNLLTLKRSDGSQPLSISIAVSRDGSKVLTGDISGGVGLWDLKTGQSTIRRGHRYWVSGVAFSPDGRRGYSTSADQTVRTWDLASGECLRVLKTRGGQAKGLALSPDGNWLAVGSGVRFGGIIEVWDDRTGALVVSLAGSAPLAFSADGKRMLSAGPGKRDTLLLWDTATWQPVETFEGAVRSLSIALSEDQKMVASSNSDGIVRLWDVGTALPRLTLNCLPRTVSLSFAPGGRRLVTADGSLRLWNTQTGAQVFELSGDTQADYCATFTADGTKVISTGDGTVSAWMVR